MLAFACSQCERSRPYVASKWFDHIYGLYLMQQGRYPFAPDDLTREEWICIGVMRRDIEAMRK